MTILRMNRRRILFGSVGRVSVALALTLLSFSAWANDFTCLKALIPATTHEWVSRHHTRYSLPVQSSSGSALAIAEWDHDHLANIFVYTSKFSKRFDRMKAVGSSEAQELRGLSAGWLKTHLFALKLESLEVFQFQVEPPGGWDGKAMPLRMTASAPELGGWLIEGEKPGDVAKPIQREIEIRETWARDNNLDSVRFKAWTKSEKFCRH